MSSAMSPVRAIEDMRMTPDTKSMTRREMVQEAKSLVAWYGCYSDNLTAIAEARGLEMDDRLFVEVRKQAARVLGFLGL
jgi:hypothetical protein